MDKLLVSLWFVQDVAKGSRPFYRHLILAVGIFIATPIVILYWFDSMEPGCPLSGPPMLGISPQINGELRRSAPSRASAPCGIPSGKEVDTFY